MKDSDPRPMPPQVLAAYRDPLNLTDLLASEVFTNSDRLAVRYELLERLIKKHGNVEVEIGKGTRTLPIRKRVAQFKKSVWNSIEVMIASEELGGREAVMLELASVMQPDWLRWWEAMSWRDYESVNSSIFISGHVLGHRQLTWLAAQHARSVVGLSSERQVSVDAISAAEAWAIVPSEENRERARRASAAAYDADAYAAACAADAAYYDTARAAARAAVRAAAYAATDAYAASYADADYPRLCELTKRLITPTLITRASRGIR